jgi:peptidoglycan/LPS O-acetylase OafA/YrhL
MSKTGVNSDKAGRSSGIDHLRSFITVLVLAFHAALAYPTFGFFDPANYLLASSAPVIDGARWVGFNFFITLTNSFFMALMFFISGLFILPSLRRKGPKAFLLDRLKRLGIPYVLSLLVISPLAYYPSYRLSVKNNGFLSFMDDLFWIGPWPVGPAWFIAMLLVFNFLVVPLQWFFGGEKIGYMNEFNNKKSFVEKPAGFFVILLVLGAAAYLPMLYFFAPNYWLTFGPFVFQVSRCVLYFVYFGLGVVLGGRGVESIVSGLGQRLGRGWILWGGVSVVAFMGQLAAMNGLYAHYTFPERWEHPQGWVNYGISFVFASAALSVFNLSLFQRFVIPPSRLVDNLCKNAYGIYLVHYPFIIWTQFTLLDLPLDVVAKFAIVFVVALLGSWGLVAFLRRFEVIGKVI